MIFKLRRKFYFEKLFEKSCLFLFFFQMYSGQQSCVEKNNHTLLMNGIKGNWKSSGVFITHREELNVNFLVGKCLIHTSALLTFTSSLTYSALSNMEVWEQVEQGYRMPAPASCPEKLYQIMLQCWSANPDDRPHFKTLKVKLDSEMAWERLLLTS